VLAQSMVGNHGFADGNKRTTVILLYTLIGRSGYAMRPRRKRENLNRAIETMIVDIAAGRMTFGQIEAWFKEYIRRV